MPLSSSKISIIICAFLTVFFLIIDQISKYFALSFLKTPVLILADFFKLELTKNPGIAFGLKVGGWPVIILTSLIILSGLFLAYRNLQWNYLSSLTVSLILSGAIGNLIDRLRWGEVIDFISIYRYPVFNLADSYITIGVIILVVFYKKIIK